MHAACQRVTRQAVSPSTPRALIIRMVTSWPAISTVWTVAPPPLRMLERARARETRWLLT